MAIDALGQVAHPRIYASVPRDEFDLGQGFCDIDYRTFARAIDRAAHWLDASLGAGDTDVRFPTFSYEGPKDLRFPILVVAAIKTHRTVRQPPNIIHPFYLLALFGETAANHDRCRCSCFPRSRQWPAVPT